MDEGETRTVTRMPLTAMETTPEKADIDISDKVKRFLGRVGHKGGPSGVPVPILPRPSAPVLTPEMEKVVEGGFQRRTKEVIIQRDPYVMITGESMRSLQDEGWLTSDIVNYYAILINERSAGWTGPKAYVYDSYAMIRILATGENRVGLCHANPRIDPFAYDVLIFPVNPGNSHWACVVVDNRARTVTYLDSYQYPKGTGFVGGKYMDAVQRFLYQEKLRHEGPGGAASSLYMTGLAENIPKQVGGVDCGIFMLQYAERVSRDAAFDFSQADIRHLRRLTAYEVLVGALLSR